MSAEIIHDYLERLSNLLRNEMRSAGIKHGLQPIQLEALHYLTLCNRYSDTPMGVTDYLGQTKGTVSQTLKILERDGLLIKKTDKKDKRITHLQVTQSGYQLLDKETPAQLIKSACDNLKQKDQAKIANELQELLQAIQLGNEMKSFGVCKTCEHNQTTEKNNYLCGLTQEPLSSRDIELICREHQNNQD